MNYCNLGLIVVLLINRVNGDVISDSLGSVITSVAKEIIEFIFYGFLSILEWILFAIIDAINFALSWIIDELKSSFSKFGTDLTSAATSASNNVVQRAGNVLDDLFSTFTVNATQQFIPLMYTGDLPPEYYLKKTDLKAEKEHMLQVMKLVDIMLYICLSIVGFGVVVVVSLCCCHFSNRRLFAYVNSLEEEMRKDLVKHEKKLRQKFEKEKRRKDDEEKRQFEIMKLLQ